MWSAHGLNESRLSHGEANKSYPQTYYAHLSTRVVSKTVSCLSTRAVIITFFSYRIILQVFHNPSPFI